MGHAGVGWIIQGWGGLGHVVKQPKKMIVLRIKI